MECVYLSKPVKFITGFLRENVKLDKLFLIMPHFFINPFPSAIIKRDPQDFYGPQHSILVTSL